MAMHSKKTEKEVAQKHATSEPSREKSFGSSPVDIGLSKGAKMSTFGYKVRGNNIWPGTVTSTDNKSGYPENRNS